MGHQAGNIPTCAPRTSTSGTSVSRCFPPWSSSRVESSRVGPDHGCSAVASKSDLSIQPLLRSRSVHSIHSFIHSPFQKLSSLSLLTPFPSSVRTAVHTCVPLLCPPTPKRRALLLPLALALSQTTRRGSMICPLCSPLVYLAPCFLPVPLGPGP